MGGDGSGRKPSAETILRRGTPVASFSNGEDAILPNYSGVRGAKEIHAKFDQVTIKGDNSTADTAYVPMVLFGADDTPPTASNFPKGTIYFEYTP